MGVFKRPFSLAGLSKAARILHVLGGISLKND